MSVDKPNLTTCLAIRLLVAPLFALVTFISPPASAGQQTTPQVTALDSHSPSSRSVEDFANASLKTSHLYPDSAVVLEKAEKIDFTREFIAMQWRPGDRIYLFVVRPANVQKPPVAVYLYGHPSDTDRYMDDGWCQRTTSGGYAAVGFVPALTGHRYHDRPMKEWFVSELQESLGKSTHDVQMVLNYLATRHDLDMDRVGMFAQGSGASIAILTSAVDPRIKVLDALDPWGDWSVWMATSSFVPEDERAEYVKADFLRKAAVLEPIDWLPKIQAKKFRLQDAVFETTTPKVAKEKLRAAVPSGATVVIYNTPEDFNAVVRDKKDLEWIKHELRSLAEAARTVAVGKD
jgi:hypothetical protein